ncbi:MAG: hypothetical protein ABIV05_00100, partial [Actinomycetota bacterium]
HRVPGEYRLGQAGLGGEGRDQRGRTGVVQVGGRERADGAAELLDPAHVEVGHAGLFVDRALAAHTAPTKENP